MEGTDSFAPNIPACFEGCELCFLARSFMGSPPFFNLLVPALTVCCSADTDVGSPYGGVSIGVHDVLLYFLRAAIFYEVRSDLLRQPVAEGVIAEEGHEADGPLETLDDDLGLLKAHTQGFSHAGDRLRPMAQEHDRVSFFCSQLITVKGLAHDVLLLVRGPSSSAVLV
jgi:hypothetical protein